MTPTPPAAVVVPDTAAVVAGTPISTKQLDEKLGARLIKLRTQEYRLRRSALDEIVTTTLLDREAAERKISTAALIAAEVDAKARPVTEEEARAVFDSARDRMGAMPEAEAIQSIMSGMQRQRASQRRSEFAVDLKTKYGVQLLLEPPRFEVATPTGPAMGPADAAVTVVEFSDFQCPYCARSAVTVKQLVEKYPGKIRLVFQDFPLPIHKEAPKAAEAAACAHDQGKFWEMHDLLFQNQDKLSMAGLKGHAVTLGLDVPAFNACLDGGKHAADWKRTKTVGEGYGITGTPAFFINGIPIFGAAPLQEFTQIIDDELARTVPPTVPARTTATRP
ncbi:MAG: thioredoxin domain-containing protein [Thermoanaerobaculia bacterium]